MLKSRFRYKRALDGLFSFSPGDFKPLNVFFSPNEFVSEKNIQTSKFWIAYKLRTLHGKLCRSESASTAICTSSLPKQHHEPGSHWFMSTSKYAPLCVLIILSLLWCLSHICLKRKVSWSGGLEAASPWTSAHSLYKDKKKTILSQKESPWLSYLTGPLRQSRKSVFGT